MTRPDGDRSKCADDECPSRTSCLRFTRPGAKQQDYTDFGRRPGAFRCADFVTNRPLPPDD